MKRAEQVQATKAAVELRSTIRVYVKEFLYDSRWPIETLAQDRLTQYETRLLPEDREVREAAGRSSPYEVWLRLWNLAGEYKHEERAQEVAQELRDEGFDVEVVPRNSRNEHALRSYGTARLVS